MQKIIKGPDQYDLTYAFFNKSHVVIQTEDSEVKVNVISLAMLSDGRVAFYGLNDHTIINVNPHSADYGKGEYYS